jgi:hypothetical protein
LLATRWEGTYQGHQVTIARNEFTRGISISWDGTEIARRTWTLIGLGELSGSAEVAGKPVDVHVTINLDGLAGQVTLTVDGEQVLVEHVA